MILHIFQYQIDKNTRLDTQNASKTQKILMCRTLYATICLIKERIL